MEALSVVFLRNYSSASDIREDIVLNPFLSDGGLEECMKIWAIAHHLENMEHIGNVKYYHELSTDDYAVLKQISQVCFTFLCPFLFSFLTFFLGGGGVNKEKKEIFLL